MTPRQFVKSADTKTTAASSRGAVDKTLRRYGAVAISVAEDLTRREIIVSFIVPDSPAKDAPTIPVRLPVSVTKIYDLLYGRPMKKRYSATEAERARPPFNGRTEIMVHDPAGYDPKRLQQAERVAWRNLVLWIDAALSAAHAGMQTITEAFFAHTVVGPSGERMIDVVDRAQQQLGAGVQRLLAAPQEEPR